MESKPDPNPAMGRRLAEAAFLLILVVAVYLLITLLSHHPADPGWSRDAAHDQVRNLGGTFGAWISDLFLFLFGYMAYVAPVLVGLVGVRILKERTEPAGMAEWGMRTLGLLMAVVTGCLLLAMQTRGSLAQPGGVIGDLLSAPMVSAMGLTGSVLFSLTLFLAGITLFSGLSWLRLVDRTGRLAIHAAT